MAVLLCRCCGARLEIKPETSVVKCGYCGVQQTVPILGFDEEALLWERAEELRRSGEYDRAMSLYEQISGMCPDEPDVYWSMVLCRYGVEYVEEPKSHRRIPTINRIQYTSVIDDENYRKAVRLSENGDQRRLYILEAKSLNALREEILSVSLNEQPYDIFICYKESDRDGRRTEDSALAAGLYRTLCAEGWRVFFSRITLEDKAGTQFEPYIFAALNSAKLMLVVGTSPENMNAVWVKNEWSRYLARMTEKGEGTLVPLYKGMLKEHLPAEFSHLYSMDMSEPDFEGELIRGVRKVIAKAPVKPQAAEQKPDEPTDTTGMLRRAELFLEDKDFSRADELCEKVLDCEPENSRAYLVKLLVEYHITEADKLQECTNADFSSSGNYAKIMRFGDDDMKSWLENQHEIAMQEYSRKLEEQRKTENERNYNRAKYLIESAESKSELFEARSLLGEMADYLDSAELYKQCNTTIKSFEEQEKIQQYQNLINARKSHKSNRKKYTVLSAVCSTVLIIAAICIRAAKISSKIERFNNTQLTTSQVVSDYLHYQESPVQAEYYDSAMDLYEKGKYSEAAELFDRLRDYKDSRRYAVLSKYKLAVYWEEHGMYSDATQEFAELGEFSDSPERVKNCRYKEADELFKKKDYEKAMELYQELGSHMDSEDKFKQAKYNHALTLRASGNYNDAIAAFNELGDYSDSEEQIVKTLNMKNNQ